MRSPASALYFVVGGDPFLSARVQADLVELLPDAGVVGLSADGVRSAIRGQTMGWIALLRFLTLIPIGFLLAGFAPRSGPRVAPALVLAMHLYTVNFLLIVLLRLGYAVFGFEATVTTSGAFEFVHFGVERCLVATWLTVGIRVLWRRTWPVALMGGVVVALLDFALLGVTFGFGMGAMEAWLGRPPGS
ncbi:MAG: hypothetical protein EA422_00335 [Gemmatimonadales bacterium]|nr:MAG: hypothetical protein EA422_00335 [Gemmatimonadales bacterium]